jgi:hypothetical protein
VPVNYTGTNNNLIGKLGMQLGRGLYSDSPPDADSIEIRDPQTGQDTVYYWGGDGWYTNGGVSPESVEITPGRAFWVVRTANAAPDRTNAVFTGQVWSDSTVSNITMYTRTGTTNGWNMVGWAMANDKVVSKADSSANQLGFYGDGANGALTGDITDTANIGDMIFIWRDGAWRQMWLIDDGTGASYNGRWWDELAWDWMDWTFKPGDAFYYYHPDNGGASDFEWDPDP